MNRIKHFLCNSIIIPCLLILTVNCDRQPVVSLESLLKEMINRETLTQYPDPEFSCKQFSSYDRATTTPGTKSWFANWDRSNFLYVDSSNGRKEHVLYDADGPGAVVRFWMTFAGDGAGEGTLRIYFDNNTEPEIEGLAFEVLSGGLVASTPLCTSVSPETNYKWRGHNFYLPLPYAEHCKITYESENIIGEGGHEGEAVYYNINYRTYEDNIPVLTFSNLQLSDAEELMELVKNTLLNPEPFTREKDLQKESFADILEPLSSDTVYIDGERAIRYLNFKLHASSMKEALRKTVLEVHFDGHRTIWTPVGDFFGTGYLIKPFKTFYNKVSDDSTMEAFWAMPFQKNTMLILHNFDDQPVIVTKSEIHHSTFEWSPQHLHFGSTWHQYTNLYTGERKNNEGDGNPFDVTYTKLKGRGIYAGDVLTVFNTAYAWWGEGDEKIWVDNDTFPSHMGTGTEDYYGYAWCRPESFSHPFIAQPTGKGNFWPGYTVNMRHRALDIIPFNDSIRVDMEMWHWVSTRINYAPATFFYLEPGSEILIEKDLDGVLAKIATQRSDIISPYMENNKMEGEKLIIDSIHQGNVSFQYGAQWNFSNDKQLFWRAINVGDHLETSFKADKSGRYNVVAYVTKAPDYGSWKITINEKTATRTINGHNETGVITERVSLGNFQINKGRNTVLFEVSETSPEKNKAYVGLDYLKFND